MAITVANKTTDSYSAPTSETTTSFTSVTGGVYVVWMEATHSTTPSTPAITGHTITWNLIASVNFNSGITTCWCFVGVQTGAGGAATLSVTHSTQYLYGAVIIVDEVLGADTTTPVVQSATNSAASGTSLTVTLAAFASPVNAALGGIYHNRDETQTVGSGFTALGGFNGALGSGQAHSFYSEGKVTSDTTVDMSWAGSDPNGGIALEIAAIAVPPSRQPIVVPSQATQQASRWRGLGRRVPKNVWQLRPKPPDATNVADQMRVWVGWGDASVWSAGAGDESRFTVGFDYSVDNTHFLMQASSLAATGAGTTTVLATEVLPVTWYWFDLVYMPGLWAAAWVDGDGPYVITGTDVPPITEGMEPGALVQAIVALGRRLSVDAIHVEWFSEATDPALLDNLAIARP